MKNRECRIATLADAPLRAAARIVAVEVRGAERERLHHHGFIENNVVSPLFEAPFGGVRVYSAMNTHVALRRELAKKIRVEIV